MNNYELILTSYPETDDFVVEIWFQNNLVAVLHENGEIEYFYNYVDNSFFKSEQFAQILGDAKEKLYI